MRILAVTVLALCFAACVADDHGDDGSDTGGGAGQPAAAAGTPAIAAPTAGTGGAAGSEAAQTPVQDAGADAGANDAGTDSGMPGDDDEEDDEDDEDQDDEEGDDDEDAGVDECTLDLECDDGLFCNGEERCDDSGPIAVCVSGRLVRSDGVYCTIDTCDEALDTVLHTPDDERCPDAVACDGIDFCDELLGCTTAEPASTADADGDGITIGEGDCDDCEELIGPGAYDFPDDGVDSDCTGTADEPELSCDGSLSIDSEDALDGARAIDLCRVSGGEGEWGVVSAAWVLPDGSAAPANDNFPLGHGLLDAFGPNVSPRAGTRLLGLSSGTARAAADPGYASPAGFSKGYSSASPAGFPAESPSCPGVVTGVPQDGVALHLTIRVPANAEGFAFDSKFYTYEWPAFICSMYNDFFLALVSPAPDGALNGNVVFDALGNPVSVNTAFVTACTCAGGPPCFAGGLAFTCPDGVSELVGTGFGIDTETDSHAATGWLETVVPVEPGSTITVRFTIYDSADGIYDSTGLIDNFRWLEAASDVETTPR